jgi:hypothetical protein
VVDTVFEMSNNNLTSDSESELSITTGRSGARGGVVVKALH